jgi:hypothetical protein
MMDDDVDALERECVAAALRLSGTKKRRRARDSWNETVDDDDDDETDAASKDDADGFNANIGREIIASCVRQRRRRRRKTVDQDVRADVSMQRNRRVTFASSSVSSDDDSDDDELKTLSDAEMERLMLAMQDALERALEREEEAMLNDAAVEGDESDDAENENKRLAEAIEAFERWKCDGEISSIDASGEGSFEDGIEDAPKTADVEVLCPVCQKNRVLANKHVLFCRCGRLRISRRDEGVGLAFLKSRLARAFESHAEDGCGQSASLTFGVRDDFGMIDALCATCSECDFLEVVM